MTLNGQEVLGVPGDPGEREHDGARRTVMAHLPAVPAGFRWVSLVVGSAMLAGCGGGSPGVHTPPAADSGVPVVVHPGAALSFTETVIDLSEIREPPVEMVVADLDNANGPDIVVIARHEGMLAILLNNGDGSFAAPAYTLAGCTGILAVGQFSADSNPDLLVACDDLVVEGFRRMRGNGDGTFAAPEILAPVEPFGDPLGQGQPHHLTIGAFGGGAGPFAESVVYAQDFFGAHPYEVLCYIRVQELIADFDVAGTFNAANPVRPSCSQVLDTGGTPTGPLMINLGGAFVLAKAPLATPDLSAFTFMPDGNLGALRASDSVTVGFGVEEYVPHPVPPFPPEVDASGDLDGDGVPEIVALDGTDSVGVYRVEPSQQLSAGFRGIAGPTFVPTIAANGNVAHVAVADLDGDAHPDLAVVLDSRIDGAGTLEVHPGDGTGSFGPPQSFSIDSTEPFRLIVADLDRDGRPDAVALGFHDAAPFVNIPRVTVHLNRTVH